MSPHPQPRAEGAWTLDGPVAIRFVGRDAGGHLEAIAGRWGAPPHPVVRLRQVHGGSAVVAQPGTIVAGDALVSTRDDLVLAVVTADCVPVVIAGSGGIAVVHAGWRGVVAGIVPAAIRGLLGATRGRADHSPLEAWIGPAIGACCYEVGADVAESVAAASAAAAVMPRRNGRPHLDLGVAVRAQLATAGVAVRRGAGPCTRCDPGWWSYRRDGAGAGRNVTLAWRRGRGVTS